ncbi:MAG: PIN domain-containing protein [Candidatus Sumerlaeaceae bacterium]
MPKNYILVDYENVHLADLPALAQPELFFMKLFLGPAHTRLPVTLVKALQQLEPNVEYIEISSSGKNALDFHIAYQIGRLAQQEPKAFFHIITKDKGFDPLIETLRAQKLHVYRCPSLADIPCLKPKPAPATKAPVAPAPKRAAVAKKKGAAITAPAIDVEPALGCLTKLKKNRPRTIQKLTSSLLTHLKSRHTAPQIDQMIASLIQKKLVECDAKDKLTYNL